MNDFLISLFSEECEAKQYVKIYYPEKLLALLTENEKAKISTEKAKKLFALLMENEKEIRA